MLTIQRNPSPSATYSVPTEGATFGSLQPPAQSSRLNQPAALPKSYSVAAQGDVFQVRPPVPVTLLGSSVPLLLSAQPYVPPSGRFVLEDGIWLLTSDAIYGYGWRVEGTDLVVSTDRPGSYRVQFQKEPGFLIVEIPDDWEKV